MDYQTLKQHHYNLFNMYSDENTDILQRRLTLFRFVYLIVKNSIYSIGYLFLYLRNCEFKARSKKEILFLCFSKNGYETLKAIYKILETQSIMLSRKIKHDSDVFLMPLFIPLLLSYLYLPKYFLFYKQASDREKKILKIHIDKILWSFGYNLFCKFYIRRYAPKAIVFANDHIAYTRILVSVAEKYGIKSFFLPHAAAYDNVPKIFSSFALLEGNHAKEKYLQSGSDKKKIKLIGMPKYDAYAARVNKNDSVKQLGICTNRSMNIEEVAELIAFIQKNFPGLAMILRPHPVMESKAKYQHIIDAYNLEYSDSKKYDAFYFLKDIDAVISGNSSILLEAALQNVFPIYYFPPKTALYFRHDRYDKYDYVKNKVAYPIDNLETLADLLTDLTRNKPNIRRYAKYYCDNICTANEGKSAALAAEIILDTIS